IFSGHLDGPRRIKKESFVLPFFRLLPHGKVSERCLFVCFVGDSKSTALLMQLPENHGPIAVHFSCNAVLPFDSLRVSHLYGVGGVPCRLVVLIKQLAPLGDRGKRLGSRRHSLLGSRPKRSEERRVGKECRCRWSP